MVNFNRGGGEPKSLKAMASVIFNGGRVTRLCQFLCTYIDKNKPYIYIMLLRRIPSPWLVVVSLLHIYSRMGLVNYNGNLLQYFLPTSAYANRQVGKGPRQGYMPHDLQARSSHTAMVKEITDVQNSRWVLTGLYLDELRTASGPDQQNKKNAGLCMSYYSVESSSEG